MVTQKFSCYFEKELRLYSKLSIFSNHICYKEEVLLLSCNWYNFWISVKDAFIHIIQKVKVSLKASLLVIALWAFSAE